MTQRFCLRFSLPLASSFVVFVAVRIFITFLRLLISCSSFSYSSLYVSPSVLARARLAPVAAFSDIFVALLFLVALLFSVLYYALYRCIFESLALLCVDVLSAK